MLLRLSTSSRASGSLNLASAYPAAVSRTRLTTSLCAHHRKPAPGIRSHTQLPSSARHRAAPYNPASGPARRPYTHRRPRQHQSSLSASLTVPVVAGVAFLIAAGLLLHRRQTAAPATVVEVQEDAGHQDPSMAPQVLPGRPGNLTPEQEEKLRQLWTMIFHVTAAWPSEETESSETTDPAAEKADSVKAEKTKKKRSLFSRKSKKDDDADSSPSIPGSGGVGHIKEGEDDKYGQTKHFHETLAKQSPESIHDTIWSMVKHDHPDALVLRFLRARKWDVDKALVMFISTMNWRAQEMHVDDDIMRNGEGAAAEAEKGEGSAARVAHDFLEQTRMGKSFLHGVDKHGRPICVVRVRLHRQGEQVEESLERYTVYLIETCRMLLQPPVDTATIVFDMTGFSMANMDYTPVKFMIKCFEANYPESLGAVLVHKAPWIFQGIWKVIKGWLDPVVAGKVNFTNNVKEVEEFIEAQHIPKELEGTEDWEYKYVEPVPGENDKMKDTETRDRLLAERKGQYRDFEEATMRWIQAGSDAEKRREIQAERDVLASKLREGYWTLDPYIRARSLYDRTGILKAGGKVDFYPTAAAAAAATSSTPAVVAPAVFETSADDVD